MKPKHYYPFALFAIGLGVAKADPVAITSLPGVTATAPYRITGNVVLETGTDYLLDTEIYVDGGTLTIQPGVLIPADQDGALIVCRGSQIFAEGTAQQPIIFTSLADYAHIKDPETNPAPEIGDNGQWGGVIILGSAPINFYVSGNPFTGATGGNTNRGENKVEGVASGADLDGDGLGDLIEYGQNNTKNNSTGLLVAGTPNPNDSSGVFKFVSIRFGGKVLGLDDEINGLTMGGVGRGTTIEYVEVINNTDDGFEWFGGTVNCKYLISAFNEDEDFDMDEGYSGTIQFAFGIREDRLVSGGVENASELDGGNGSIFTGTPLTTAKVWNATLLGAGRTGEVANAGNVFRMKDNYAGQWHNSVFDDFGGNLVRIDDTNTAARVGNELRIENTTWGRFNGLVAQGQTAAATALVGGAGNSAPGTDPLFRGISRMADGMLDPRPRGDSPLLSGTVSSAPAGVTQVSYRGAFGTTNWASGWSFLATNGYFGNLPSGLTELPPFVDTDGDGLSDFLEGLLVEYGFDKNVAQAALVSAFSANQGLYTEASIQDLRGTGVIVRKSGNSVTLELPVYKSNLLSNDWVPAGTLSETFTNVPEDKQFYRLQVDGLE